MSHEHLPDELLWADGGHASDIVLTAIADGQLEIVPQNARAHVESCTACMQHLGNAALLSLHAGRQLAARAQYDASFADKRMPLPRLAIALGITPFRVEPSAHLAAVPVVQDDARRLEIGPHARTFLARSLASARASFAFISPSFERTGMRNGRIFTRCGALRSAIWRS